ncbi:D-alanyl-D-alanine carboxypeptidase family protein [Streptomyces gilvosporeus]|uniref:D-alanyl-D-alanine carboxypeptidase n=1 Tax=Streptomyces gilvosporeus TaxID=553510 RepID=A0A1V0TV25_9ACTN|nr:serine hydrolase [Streptomyces gilvosporeus]ARF56741.1 D-alanyl-D-alanine carboxypeptidase [Streptomyces gilvosporeus]
MKLFAGTAVRRGGAGAALTAAAAALAVALPAPVAQAASAAPGIQAKGAYLQDGGSGRSLWSRSADTPREMASTTKVMTAVVVLEAGGLNLNRKITVKRAYRDYVARHGASTADLRTGDKLTVRQLLYGMLLPSGCDASYALADTFGTGRTMAQRTQSFIARMNARARTLGLARTHYDSFDGIAHGRTYTSPRDLVRLARHALRHPLFAAIVKTARTRQQAANVHRTYTWYNTNRLLGSYRGAIGIKTGTARRAGDCLVFAAQRGGRTVVGAVLNDPYRFRDAARMLDYAFRRR